MNGQALALQGVVKDYGDRRVLHGLDLNVAPGEVYALLGPNGAGKTTTLNLILGFLRADAGRIEVAGQPVDTDPLAARAAIAYLPETVMLYAELTAIENLRYFALLGDLRLDDAKARQALTAAGVPEEAQSRRTVGFSKGMRQKVGIAIALARRAALLLLDEPSSGLDPTAAEALSAALRKAATSGLAVLMVTHDLPHARSTADRVGMLAGGRLVFERATSVLVPGELEASYAEQERA
jgi:ABC-2 type transport system ATP-binding protein